jgi:hypothetical protein
VALRAGAGAVHSIKNRHCGHMARPSIDVN